MKNIIKISALIIFSFIFIGCVPKEDPSIIINSYYDNVKNSSYEAIFNTLSAASQKQCSKDDFINWQTTQNEVTKLKDVKITKKNENKNMELDGTTYKNVVEFEITETLHYNYDDKDDNLTYSRYVVNDNGEWKVYRDNADVKERLLSAMNSLASMYQDGKGKDKNLNEAATILNDAIQKDSEYQWTYYNLGRVYLELGRLDESLNMVNTFLNKDIDDQSKSDAYNVLGVIYENKFDYAQSKENYQKAIELNPNNQYARTNLERVKNY